MTKNIEDLANPDFALAPRSFIRLGATDPYQILEFEGARVRVQRVGHGIGPPRMALVPLDRLFEVRVAALIRLWRALTDKAPGVDAGTLTDEQRNRLALALRALDGRLSGATHPVIAAALFDTEPISKRDWISHELRDQTGRLVRRGLWLMKGGYRQLLLYPYRRRI